MAPFSSVVGKRPHAARLMAVLANSTWWQDIFADAAKIEPEAPETSGPSAIPINGCGCPLRLLRVRSVHHPAARDGEEQAQRQRGAAQDVLVAGDGPEIHEGLRWNAYVCFQAQLGDSECVPTGFAPLLLCTVEDVRLICRVDGGSDVFASSN